MSTHYLARGDEVVSFRVLGPDVIRLKRLRGDRTVEIQLLTREAARRRWADLRAEGYRVMR